MVAVVEHCCREPHFEVGDRCQWGDGGDLVDHGEEGLEGVKPPLVVVMAHSAKGRLWQSIC